MSDTVNRHKLRALREGAQISVTKLAEKVGASQPFITQIEQGYKQPSVPLLKRIADYFGVTVDDLLRDDTQETA